MRKIHVWVILVLGVVALGAQAQGQSRKPGLWEITATVSMAGMPQMPQMGAHTTQVCVTQAMIDKYGSAYSGPQQKDCQTTDVSVTPTGMTAKIVCTGQMSMTGTVTATFVDANTTKSTMHMTMNMGGRSMDMTTESTSTYKGPDCGSVKPLAVPASN